MMITQLQKTISMHPIAKGSVQLRAIHLDLKVMSSISNLSKKLENHNDRNK